MRKIIVSLLHCSIVVLLSTYCLVPSTTFAASVGFVPSTGLWFSRSEFLPHETVRIYTVVINNDYYSLDGTVTFYDNGQIIDSADVKALTKESVKQIRVFWEPTEGEHSVSAQFTKAVATDEKGVKQVLDVDTINSIAGAPLKVGDGVVEPTLSVSLSTSTTLGSVTLKTVSNKSAVGKSGVLGGTVDVLVRKEGNKLALAPQPQTDSNAFGGDNQLVPVNTTDVFAKNREILDKASQVAGTITTTAGKINDAYNQTQGIIEKGKSYYIQAKEVVQNVSPYVEKAAPFWDIISNNNDPRYIIGIVGGIVLLWYIIRWRRRHRRARDPYND